MGNRNIIVVGASAGGFEVLKRLAADIPADINASIFIVWHMSPDVRSILPQVLSKIGTLPAAHPADGEPITQGRIYVAPPDHHLLLDKGKVRITRGPKENRFRPAVDPLFRSAALEYGARVVGVVLSGALDDGSAGLWAIKQRGGIAVVQDPVEAEVSSMPENAIKAVDVDHIVPVSQMGVLLQQLVNDQVPEENGIGTIDLERTRLEVNIAMEEKGLKNNIMDFSKLSPYTCPECHGVLAALSEGGRLRFRCHTGHAFSADSLLAALTENIEDSLWNAIRGVQESVMLLNHMGDHFAEINQPKLAAMYFKKARDAEKRADVVRTAVLNHEQLSADGIRLQADEVEGSVD